MIFIIIIHQAAMSPGMLFGLAHAQHELTPPGGVYSLYQHNPPNILVA